MPSFQSPMSEKRKSDFAGLPTAKRVNITNSSETRSSEDDKEYYWMVQWRNFQGRKHKTWEGDAILVALNNGAKSTLYDTEGKPFSSGKVYPPFLEGKFFSFGGKEFELDRAITKDEYLSGSCFDVNAAFASRNASPLRGRNIPKKPFLPPKVGPTSAPSQFQQPSSASLTEVEAVALRAEPADSAIAPTLPKGYTSPLYPDPKLVRHKNPVPLHDPNAQGAIVMRAPSKEHIERYNKKNRPLVPVVLDPMLARRMRSHQHEGVQFIYECVMGLRKHEGQGCILADEMGLGKTLQTIGLVWTLLKQNPYAGAGPVIGKALIVCPVSLINNWKAEFYKWLGRDRVGVTVCDKGVEAAKTFANSPRQQVLIVGYERLRIVVKEIASCGIGLIICDEGHRLKSAKAKTAAVFKQLNTPRRIILSGTPIQNDLGEFHSMVDFCNPGLLDDYCTFRRVYETPILNSRMPTCTAKQSELGQKRSEHLSNLAKSFVLRREASILGRFLPPKYEYVIFVLPTKLQLILFLKLLDPSKVDDVVQGSTVESLALINILTKISTSPILLKAAADRGFEDIENNSVQRSNMHDAVKLLPKDSQIDDLDMSGKLLALSRLLSAIKENTEEKCVLVSHYTSTLNILEAFCKKMKYTYLRLDGQTPSSKRLEYVNTFNKTSQKTSFIFLLSSKAGGIGINLIGASRLCLVDSDWNPSHDLQAMARCHRDGQKRPVFIYRFLTTGTIDEKIYQRQIIKLGLSTSLMGSDMNKSSSKADSFTRKDLRDIFRVHQDTVSNTHDLLECTCHRPISEMDNEPPSCGAPDKNEETGSSKDFIPASQVEPGQFEKLEREYCEKKKDRLVSLGEWRHIPCIRTNCAEDVKDDILRHILCNNQGTDGTNTSSSLPSSSRLDTFCDMGSSSTCIVPGGTISFLFERCCSVVLENSSEEDTETNGVTGSK